MAVKSTSLILLSSALAHLGLTSDGGSQDAQLEAFIDAASEMFEEHCGRVFSRAAIVDEEVAGFDTSLDLLLARPPINDATVAAMTFKYLDDELTDLTNISIDHRAAGILRSDTGWNQQSAFRGGIAGDPQPGTEKKSYKVSYDGGFVTEVQNAESGGTYEGVDVTLPGYVKLGMLMTISSWWRSKGKNPNMTGEKIGDASENYASGGVGGIPKAVLILVAPVCINLGS